MEEDDFDSTIPFDKNRKPKGKANKILLGVDASREKLKETLGTVVSHFLAICGFFSNLMPMTYNTYISLGLEDDELALAEQERLDRMEEEYSRYRENLKGKRGNEKALDILGENYFLPRLIF
jgi:hypothetical protein